MPLPAESAKSGNANACAVMRLHMVVLCGNVGSWSAVFQELLALLGPVGSVFICCAKCILIG